MWHKWENMFSFHQHLVTSPSQNKNSLNSRLMFPFTSAAAVETVIHNPKRPGSSMTYTTWTMNIHELNTWRNARQMRQYDFGACADSCRLRRFRRVASTWARLSWVASWCFIGFWWILMDFGRVLFMQIHAASCASWKVIAANRKFRSFHMISTYFDPTGPTGYGKPTMRPQRFCGGVAIIQITSSSWRKLTIYNIKQTQIKWCNL